MSEDSDKSNKPNRGNSNPFSKLFRPNPKEEHLDPGDHPDPSGSSTPERVNLDENPHKGDIHTYQDSQSQEEDTD